MDKVPRAALAALLCLFLAACGDACGDEEAEASRAGVRETARIVPSASPTPPAEEPGPASTPARGSGPTVTPTPSSKVPIATPVKKSVQPVTPTPSAAGPGLASSPARASVSPVAGVRDRKVSDPPESAPDNDRQATHAGPDDPASSISINGAIAFPNTRRVVFDTQGALGRLAVEEGRAVTAGQPLAHMDRATVTALEGALAQARVDASKAREALADVLAPPSPLEIVRAEAKVADAGESLRTAEERLLSLLRPTDQEMAAAESVHADTVLKIDALRREIDSLVGGPDEKELEHLRVHARSDQVVLENALRGESLAEEEWEARIGRASGESRLPQRSTGPSSWSGLGVEAHDVDAAWTPTPC